MKREAPHLFEATSVPVTRIASGKSLRIAAIWMVAAFFAVPAIESQVTRKNGQSDNIVETLALAHQQQRVADYSGARTILMEALLKAPKSAALLAALGSVEQDRGKYLEAERLYLQALSVSERSEDNREFICILNNLGTLYLDTGQFAKGERVRAQLVKVPSLVLDSHPRSAALLLNVIGGLEHARNRDAEAIRYYAQALEFLRKVPEPVSADLAAVESSLGFLHLEAAQYELAKDFFRRAIHNAEIALVPDGRRLISSLVNLAKCENMTGNPKDAEALARRAVELSSRTFGSEHLITATAMAEQANALRSLKRKPEARELEKCVQAALRYASTDSLDRHTVDVKNLARSHRNAK